MKTVQFDLDQITTGKINWRQLITKLEEVIDFDKREEIAIKFTSSMYTDGDIIKRYKRFLYEGVATVYKNVIFLQPDRKKIYDKLETIALEYIKKHDIMELHDENFSKRMILDTDTEKMIHIIEEHGLVKELETEKMKKVFHIDMYGLKYHNGTPMISMENDISHIATFKKGCDMLDTMVVIDTVMKIRKLRIGIFTKIKLSI